MQILRLKLCNLASLAGEHCIDFQQEPLKSAGLIAITGRTGSGKSTLLDALCLALYNQIPRFKSTTGQGITSEFSHANDTRQILTRGTAYAYAEVEFMGIDKKRYISRTDISRAYKKVDGTLKNNTRSLISVDDQHKVLSTKIKECDTLIIEKTGLEFEQFIRVVLLAQSEVGAFLKAPDDKRAQLLEHLTGSGIFKRIGELAGEQYSKVKSEYQQAQKLVEMVELLAPEILSEKKAQYQLLTQQLLEIENEIKQYQQQEKIHLDYQQLQQELKHYQQALSNLQQEDVQSERDTLLHYELYQQIVAEWKQLQELNQKCQRVQQEIQVLTQEIAIQQEQEKQADIHQQQLSQQYQQQMPQLKQQLLDSVQILDDVKSRQNLRDEFKQQKQKLKDKEQDWQLKNHELKEKQQSLINIENQLAILQNQAMSFDYLPQNSMILLEYLQNYQTMIQDIELKIKNVLGESIDIEQWLQGYQQLQKSYTQFSEKVGQLEQIQTQRKDYFAEIFTLQQQKQHYQAFIQQLDIYMKQQQTITDLNHQIQELNHTIQQEKLREQTLQQALDSIHIQWQHADEILQKQKLIQSQDVVFLRTQLEENQPCVVCGSIHHPWREQKQESSLLALHEQQVQFFVEQKEQMTQQLLQHQKQLSGYEHKLQYCQDELLKVEAQKKQQYDMLMAQDIAIQCMQDKSEELWQTLAQQNLDDIVLKIERCNESIQQLDEMIEQFNLFNQQLEQHRDIEQSYRILMVNDEKIRTYLSHDLLTQWQNQKMQSLQQWVSDIQQKHQYEQKIQEQQQSQTQYQADIVVLQKEQQYHQTNMQDIGLVITKIEEQGKVLTQKIQQICQKYQQQDLIDIVHFEAWHNKIEHEIELLQQQLEQSKTEHEHIQHDLDKKRNHLALMAKYLQEDIVQQQRLEQYIQQWQKQHTKFNDSVLLELSEKQDLKESITDLKQKITSYEQKKIELESHFALTQQKINQLNIEKLVSYNDLCQLLVQLHEQQKLYREESQNLGAILKSQEYEQARLAKYEESLGQMSKEYQRWQRIYDLIGINKGGEFQKIAQQHYLDILLEYANFQLRQLTQRYELKRIEQSLSLSIIDHDMNDEQRGVLSLSGGESFLVSLALALGIAHMASSHLQLEMLFIDEGFGTLDQNSLHIVMDTLDRLQGQGRKVILISHIQEIHERIPVQIKVEPKMAGYSDIRII